MVDPRVPAEVSSPQVPTWSYAMRTMILLAVVGFFAPAAAVAADPKEERASLEGKWAVSEMTFDGMVIPRQQLIQVPWYWEIGEKKIISKRPGSGGKFIHEEEIEFVLDPSKIPKTIEVTDVAAKKTSKGIYEIVDDDVLKLCIPAQPTGERPTDFDAKKGERVGLDSHGADQPEGVDRDAEAALGARRPYREHRFGSGQPGWQGDYLRRSQRAVLGCRHGKTDRHPQGRCYSERAGV